MNKYKVLVIDDEEEFTTALAERLETRGMAVETALSGEQALEKAVDHEFDAVLLDLAMPGWNGIETLKRLKKAKPDLQIILLTGRATVGEGVEAMKLGALDLVEKPAKLQDLLEKIEEASAQKTLLFEERVAQDLDEIMRKKGW
ncbi:MAG: response regulator [Myxococcota bacterium]|nr:response regulator [Myxococcota bacterium]